MNFPYILENLINELTYLKYSEVDQYKQSHNKLDKELKKLNLGHDMAKVKLLNEKIRELNETKLDQVLFKTKDIYLQALMKPLYKMQLLEERIEKFNTTLKNKNLIETNQPWNNQRLEEVNIKYKIDFGEILYTIEGIEKSVKELKKISKIKEEGEEKGGEEEGEG